jgi:hypothetical protein
MAWLEVLPVNFIAGVVIETSFAGIAAIFNRCP